MKNKKRLVAFIVIAFIVLIGNISFMTFELFEPIKNEVAIWSFIDIAVCLPIFYYLLVIRKQYSPYTIIPFIVICFWIAYSIFPKGEFIFSTWISNGLIGFEIGIVGLELILVAALFVNIKRFVKNYKRNQWNYPLYLNRLVESFNDTFPKGKKVYTWVTDVSVLYYLFFSWKKRNSRYKETNGFTFHKNTAYFGVFLMLIHAMLIEIIGVHFALLQINHTLAWVVTFLDIYTLLFLIADYRAIVLSPIYLKEDFIHIQKGIRVFLLVKYEDIEYFGVTQTNAEERKKERNSVNLLFAGFEEEKPQYEIVLKKPVTSYHFYGIKKQTKKIYLTVDNPKDFERELSAKIKTI